MRSSPRNVSQRNRIVHSMKELNEAVMDHPCIKRLRRMKHFAWQAGWRSTTRPNMGVGWTLRRLSFLRLPASVSERIVFLIWERSGICFNHGIRIGTRNRKVSTGNLLRLMPGLSSNGCTRQSTFSCYTLLEKLVKSVRIKNMPFLSHALKNGKAMKENFCERRE